MSCCKGGDEMDVTVLTQLVGSLGFPIAMCIAMLWMLNRTNENHKMEMEKITEALNNNTVALTQLSAKIEGNK